jgi:hypothetical protein
MSLLLVFLISLIVGQSISVSLGLLVERHSTPYTGLVTFIGCFFAMIWLAWRFAVRITEPRSRLGGAKSECRPNHERGKSGAILLGASAAADDLWSHSTILVPGL